MMRESTIEIGYYLPRDVMLLGGKLTRNPEMDGDYPWPERIQCAARTGRGKRCLNVLEFGKCVTEWWGSVEIGGHEFNVRTEDSREFTPERLDRWQRQLCEVHYRMKDNVTYFIQPQWQPYDIAGDIAEMCRISKLVDEL